VTFDDLLKTVNLADAPASYIMAYSEGAYTTNIPVADLVNGQGMIATRYEGLPILPRMVVQPGPRAASLLLEKR
jgi:DMSO/TMAO reductase YedYZ molybdopterin-dependent catalytic subunit